MTEIREQAKKRAAQLKELRERHQDTVARTQALLKEHNATRKPILQQLRAGPKTVPEIVAATDLPSEQILWHITALKKYGLVTETGQNGEYYQYAMAEEAES